MASQLRPIILFFWQVILIELELSTQSHTATVEAPCSVAIFQLWWRHVIPLNSESLSAKQIRRGEQNQPWNQRKVPQIVFICTACGLISLRSLMGLPFLNIFFGLFIKWIYERNPKDLGIVLSGTAGYEQTALKWINELQVIRYLLKMHFESSGNFLL